MFDQDIKGLNMSDGDTRGFPTYRTFIIINVVFGVTSVINVAAMARHERYNQLRHTYAQPAEIQVIHTSRHACYLIAWLPLLLFHSHKHNPDKPPCGRVIRRRLRQEERPG